MASTETSHVPFELKLYPPPASAVQGAHVSGMAAYDKLCAEAEADYAGYWARLAREFVTWKTPFTKVLDESNAPFFKWFEDGTLNVSYNCLDRQVEAGLGDKVAIIFEADDGKVTPRHLQRPAGAHLPPRQCAEGARRQEGRPRRHLHVDVGRGRGRDAGLRAHRRDALGRLRRLLGAEPARPHQRRRRGDGDHRRRAVARRQAAAAEGHRRRGARARRLREHQGRDRLPAHRRQDRLERAARPVAARGHRRPAGDLRARVGRRRAPAVPALHLGLDRQAQGRAAQQRRLPAARGADDEVDLRPEAATTSSGAPPTSAGSPATPTSPTGRWRSAAPRSCSRACRPTPTPAASGR